jgi:TolA-binding protein
MQPKRQDMPRRVLACVTAVVILGFLGYHYLRTTLQKEVQKQDRRVEAQAEFIKAQEQRIVSQQQQIASLQQQIQTDEAMQRRLARLERQLRALEQKAEEAAEAQPLDPAPCEFIRQRGIFICAATRGGAVLALLSPAMSMN